MAVQPKLSLSTNAVIPKKIANESVGSGSILRNAAITLLLLVIFFAIFAIYYTLTCGHDNIKTRKASNVNLNKNNSWDAASLSGYLDTITDFTYDPCEEFFEYTCAEYVRMNNRTFIATAIDMSSKNYIKLADLVSKPIEKRDNNAVKMGKAFYQKCVHEAITGQFHENVPKRAFDALKEFPRLSGFEFPYFFGNNYSQPMLDSDEMSKAWAISFYRAPIFDNGIMNLFEFKLMVVDDKYVKLVIKDPTFIQQTCSAGNLTAAMHEKFNEIYGVLQSSKIMYERTDYKGQIDFDKFADDLFSYLNVTMRVFCGNKQKLKDVTNVLVDNMKYTYINFRALFRYWDEWAIANVSLSRLGALYTNELYFVVIDQLVSSGMITTRQLVALMYFNQMFWYSTNYSVFTSRALKMNLVDVLGKRSVLFSETNKASRVKDESKIESGCLLMLVKQYSRAAEHIYLTGTPEEERRILRQKLMKLVNYIRMGFYSMLVGIRWLDDRTRAAAFLKLSQMDISLLGAQGLENGTLMNQMIKDRSHAEWRELFYRSSRDLVAEILQGVVWADKKSEFIDQIHRVYFQRNLIFTANAAYYPNHNSLLINLGIVQRPMFDLDWPMEWNFGALGSVIGHEISHAFDSNGVNFDAKGERRQWFNINRKEFQKITSCIVDEYSRFCLKENPKICVNGSRTLAENMADNAGLHAAFRGFYYFISTSSSPAYSFAETKYESLRDGQLFFIGFAQYYCNTVDPPIIEDSLDEHTPMTFRPLGVLRNNPVFGNVYHCLPGSAYYPSNHRCEVWYSDLSKNSSITNE